MMPELGMSKEVAGILGSATLLASAAGGLFFGVVADRYGRTRALMASVLIYSIFTAACGLAQNIAQLAVFRVLLGIGMGGEWASGAALVSETWPAEHRGKALGLMQSAWAIGYGAAAVVTALVLPRWGWRAVFFVGILPAFLTLWVRHSVREPAMWRERARAAAGRPRPLRRHLPRRDAPAHDRRHDHERVHAVRLVGIQSVAAGVPVAPRLVRRTGSLDERHGVLRLRHANRDVVRVRDLRVRQRRRRPQAHLHRLPGHGRDPHLRLHDISAPLGLLVLGPLVAFFATGYFSGFGAVTAEIYQTAIRARAQGFTYNMGALPAPRRPSPSARWPRPRGFHVALLLTSAAFLLAALTWIWIPETRGRQLA